MINMNMLRSYCDATLHLNLSNNSPEIFERIGFPSKHHSCCRFHPDSNSEHVVHLFLMPRREFHQVKAIPMIKDAMKRSDEVSWHRRELESRVRR
jgi:hypothetical protein